MLRTSNAVSRTTTTENPATCPDNSGKINHTPFGTPETTNMRYISLIAYIIFFSSYLILRLFLSIFRSRNKNFFMKGITLICRQTLLYFLCLSVLVVMYVYGLFDNIFINWELFLASLALFGIGWVIFSLIVLLIAVLATIKWKELEKLSKNSLSKKKFLIVFYS